MDTKRITITVDRDLHTALKHLSIVENKNLSELVINAIKDQYNHKFDKMDLGKFKKE